MPGQTVAEFAKNCKVGEPDMRRISPRSNDDDLYHDIGRNRVRIREISSSVDPYLASLERHGGTVQCNAPLPLPLSRFGRLVFGEPNMHDLFLHYVFTPANLCLEALGYDLGFCHEVALAGRPKTFSSQQSSTQQTPDFILAREDDSERQNVLAKGNQVMAVELKHRLVVEKDKRVPGIPTLGFAHLGQAAFYSKEFGISIVITGTWAQWHILRFSWRSEDNSAAQCDEQKEAMNCVEVGGTTKVKGDKMILRPRDPPRLLPSPSISREPLGNLTNASTDPDSVPIHDPQTPKNQNSPDIHSSGGYVPSDSGTFTPVSFAQYTNKYICDCDVVKIDSTKMKKDLVRIIVGVIVHYFRKTPQSDSTSHAGASNSRA
ncbi:hypothetical protein F4802DRAFT_576749 [Xylaria palmicola]|nr:hypothetical protein F4802DRAFT_576749 [Xylaria palmicola]